MTLFVFPSSFPPVQYDTHLRAETLSSRDTHSQHSPLLSRPKVGNRNQTGHTPFKDKSRHNYTHIKRHLIFNKETKDTHWRKYSILKNCAGQTVAWM